MIVEHQEFTLMAKVKVVSEAASVGLLYVFSSFMEETLYLKF